MAFSEVIIYIFVIPLIAWGFISFKRWRSYFADRGIPYIKPSSYLLGNLSGIGKTDHLADCFRKTYEECKNKDVIAGFYMMIQPVIILTDLELIKIVMVKEFSSFTDRGTFNNEENEPLTGSLFDSTGENWKFLRSKLSPVFTAGKMKMMYSMISEKGDDFVKKIEGYGHTQSIDIKDVTTRFTLDVICSCGFGFEAKTLDDENPELLHIFKDIIGLPTGFVDYINFMLTFCFPNFSKALNIRRFSRTIEKVVQSLNERQAKLFETIF